jgi:hypothetical protein
VVAQLRVNRSATSNRKNVNCLTVYCSNDGRSCEPESRDVALIRRTRRVRAVGWLACQLIAVPNTDDVDHAALNAHIAALVALDSDAARIRQAPARERLNPPGPIATSTPRHQAPAWPPLPPWRLQGRHEPSASQRTAGPQMDKPRSTGVAAVLSGDGQRMTS